MAIMAALALGLVSGCAGADGGREATHDDLGLTIFAAASLRDVLAELEPRFEAAHPGVGLTIAYDGSNILAAQIREGAPADVFVSADTERPSDLAAAGLTAASPVPFARNHVALVVPVQGRKVMAAEDLADAGVRIVAAGPGVPISSYAAQALEQLAARRPDGEDFLARVEANTASREDNVRAALAKVELGEGDAALVYASDARSSRLVREVALPPGVEVTADYAAVQVTDRPAAAEFVAWLRGPEASAALSAAGFEPVSR